MTTKGMTKRRTLGINLTLCVEGGGVVHGYWPYKYLNRNAFVAFKIMRIHRIISVEFVFFYSLRLETYKNIYFFILIMST
jgi:hypothetical protein